ncbi:MAG: PTS sugar transporter subunit IIA [Elusimicrobia bacterium]|nr:PTS sugar transporter subunit IIA [Elusimicrobiota bacterium]
MIERISDLLSEDVVLFAPADAGKDAALEALAGAICRRAGVADAAALLAKVRERERGISTILDTGLSLPHARVGGLTAFLAGLSVFKTPARDAGRPVRAVFLFFSPDRPEDLPRHLQFLRDAAALFTPALLELLAAAPDPAAALALLRARD